MTQPTTIKIPDTFNMKNFAKFLSLYNALIVTENADIIMVNYYNNQGMVNMFQLRDHTEDEHNKVLMSWATYSKFFKDTQLIFDVIKDSNFTRHFDRNMMRILNNIYKCLILQYGWTIMHLDIIQPTTSITK